MASRTGADPRRWACFWSTIKGKDRFRHEVKVTQQRKDRPAEAGPPKWMVRTEVYMGTQPIYHTVSTVVPEEVGRYLRSLAQVWSNIDEKDRPMFPPEFPGGFPQMAAAVDFRSPSDAEETKQG